MAKKVGEASLFLRKGGVFVLAILKEENQFSATELVVDGEIDDRFPATKLVVDRKTGNTFRKYMPDADQWIAFLRRAVEPTVREWELSEILKEGIRKYELQKDRDRIYKAFGFTLPKSVEVKAGCGLTMFAFLNIFHSDTTGYITGSQLSQNGDWKERHFKSLNKLMTAVNPKENSYFSVNTMYRKKRAVENVREITAFWLDLDIYNAKMGQRKARNVINKGVEQGMFPKPTLVCSSGGGLYVFWKIGHVPGKSRKVLALWQSIMSVFLDNAKELGLSPDYAAKDVARVLRIMGTKNSRWDRQSKVLEYNEDAVYTLRELGKEWYPEKKKKAKKKETRQKSPHKKNRQLGYIFNSFSLNKARIADIEKIFKHRGEKKVPHPNRELTLFIYRYFVSLLEGDGIALKKTLELNRQLSNPLSESEILRDTKTSASMRMKIENEDKVIWNGEEKPAGYNYSNKTLIEIFKLKQEEMQLLNLSTIISVREKYDRDNIKQRNARRGDDGLTVTERMKMEQHEQVQVLKAQGMTQMQVSKELSISLSTVKRYWKTGLK